MFDRLSQERIEQIDTQLEKIEAAIVDHIHADPRLREQYVLLLSVDGVGPVLAAHSCMHRRLYTLCSARRLACQAGVAPTSTLRAPASMVAHAYLHKPTAC
ncbi:MAG: hypothetical protein IPG69_04830 [Flavobacteriales bacterium]|nr:hypothetical protein [Flavobacteriales bacterium]